jgi:hypothetical protein
MDRPGSRHHGIESATGRGSPTVPCARLVRACITRLQDLSMSSSFCKKPLARSSRPEARRLVSRRGRPVPRGRTDANRRVVDLVLSRRRGGQDLARLPPHQNSAPSSLISPHLPSTPRCRALLARTGCGVMSTSGHGRKAGERPNGCARL